MDWILNCPCMLFLVPILPHLLYHHNHVLGSHRIHIVAMVNPWTASHKIIFEPTYIASHMIELLYLLIIFHGFYKEMCDMCRV